MGLGCGRNRRARLGRHGPRLRSRAGRCRRPSLCAGLSHPSAWHTGTGRAREAARLHHGMPPRLSSADGIGIVRHARLAGTSRWRMMGCFTAQISRSPHCITLPQSALSCGGRSRAAPNDQTEQAGMRKLRFVRRCRLIRFSQLDHAAPPASPATHSSTQARSLRRSGRGWDDRESADASSHRSRRVGRGGEWGCRRGSSRALGLLTIIHCSQPSLWLPTHSSPPHCWDRASVLFLPRAAHA